MSKWRAHWSAQKALGLISAMIVYSIEIDARVHNRLDRAVKSFGVGRIARADLDGQHEETLAMADASAVAIDRPARRNTRSVSHELGGPGLSGRVRQGCGVGERREQSHVGRAPERAPSRVST